MFRSLRERLLIVMVGIVVVISATFALITQREVEREMAEAEGESAKNVLRLVMLDIESKYKGLLFYKASALQRHKRELKNLTAVVITYINGYYEKYKKGLLSEKQAKSLAAEGVRGFRYGNNNYFFIIDKDFTVVSHPDPAEMGSDASDLMDIKGNYIVRPMMEVAMKEGEGYTRYWWKRLGDDTPAEKLSYSTYYPQWGWMIGTGVYIDDIKAETEKKVDAIIEELRETFSRIKIAKTGYLFLFNGKKELIIHPTLSRMDASRIKNPGKETFIVDDLIAASKNPDKPIEYLWDKPSDKGNFRFLKQSYVDYFEPLDWYVASSVYKDEINMPAKALSQKILLIFVFFLSIITALSAIFANTLSVPIRNLIEAMKDVTRQGLSSINVPVGGTSEIKELGEIFNSMLGSINDAVKAKDRYAEKLEETNRKLEDFNTELENLVQERTKELVKAYNKLQELDRMKTDFLSTVSHELRTPLTSVLGFARIIRKRLEEVIIPALKRRDARTERAIRQVRENLDIIISEGERLTLLINDVLDVAKIEAGGVEWKEEDVDMADVFRQAAHGISSLIEQKGLFIRPDVRERGLVVRGDRDRLLQVATNLLSNALKFTDSGGITYRISRRDGMLRCEVEDSGCGIPAETIEVIFEKFKQAGDALTDRPRGTGLGLPICREIVKYHGGRIWAENRESGGSRFIFELPLPAEESPATGGASHRSLGEEPGGAAGGDGEDGPPPSRPARPDPTTGV